MGKQKGYRKIQGALKKSEKKEVKSSKLPPNLQVELNIKNIRHVIEEEIEFAFWRKKFNKTFRKELESYPLLARAAFIGCEKAVDELLEAGEDVNERISDGSTPLMIAVEKGNVAIVAKLLKAGADLRLARNNGMNALMLAVSKNDNKIFSLLWDHLDKNDIWILNQENSDGYTILTIAVERGYVEHAKFFSGLNVVRVDHQTGEGKSALMLAAMRSQPEIVKCLLERGASVLLEDMKRVELLYKPRVCSSLEITCFYKEILFRVVLAIKRLLENGRELLIKYKIFFPLLKCIEMNKTDSELVWQAFHLAACLMYDTTPNDTPVLKSMAELFAEAKGLDSSLETFSCFKNDPDVKDAAFLPVQACCIECGHGKVWLKENFCRIRKHVNEFKSNLPMLRFWLQDEVVNAEVVFDRFEMIIKSVITEKEDLIIHLAAATYNDSLDSFDLETEFADDKVESIPVSVEIKPSRESSITPVPSVSTQVKRKAEISRKVKNIKFHTKFERKKKTKPASQKINVNFPVEVFQNSSKKMNLPALNSQTGYADALKRNLTHKIENELEVDQFLVNDSESLLEKIYSENNSSMDHSITDVTKHDSKIDCVKEKINLSPESDINENIVNEIKSYASVVSQRNGIKSENSLQNVKGDSISRDIKNGTLNEISSICTKVKEPCKLFSFVTKLYPSLYKSDEQNSSQVTDDKEFPVSSNNSLDLETEINSYFDKDDILENYTFKDSAKEKMYQECNADIIALYASKDLHSKEKWTDEQAENLISLFESLNTVDKTSQSIAVNYPGGDIDFEKYKEEKLSRNRAPILEVDEKTLKYIQETGYTPQFEVDQAYSKRQNKNRRIDEIYRDVTRRTYCEVARMNIDKSAEDVKNLPKDKGIEYQQELVKLKQDDTSLKSSLESLELENFCKLIEMELNSELTCSDSGNSSEKLETGEIDSSSDSEDASDNDSEDLSRLQANRPDKSIYKSYFGSRLAEYNSYKINVDKNLENEKLAQNFNLFSTVKNEIDETNAINTKTTKNSESSFSGNFGLDTLNKNYKLRCLESIRQRIVTLEDLNISPITCQLKLLSLQKHLTLYQRLCLQGFSKQSMQNVAFGPNQAKMDFDMLATNYQNPFLNPLKKKITIFTDSNCFPNIVIKIGKKSAVRVGSYHSKESNCFKLFNKLSKVDTVKIRKDFIHPSRLKPKSLIARNDTEVKRKTAREEALTRRRALKSGHFFDGEVNERARKLDSGFVPNFINCESDSKWYHALKNLQSCVPLGQLLVDSFSRDAIDSSKASNVHSLDSAAGKIVFATKMECTLREGTFGTYTGLIVNTGTPVRIRQFGVSSFMGEKAALSLSKNRLLKHKTLVILHDAVINPKDFKMYLVSELCEYSLPQYLKMANICQSRPRVPACNFRKLFVIDLVEGVRYLHRTGIVHGHLK
ncbi:unnamed protein product, partial [Larinioides sclopetarius]